VAAQRSHKEAGKRTAEIADSKLSLEETLRFVGVKMNYYISAH